MPGLHVQVDDVPGLHVQVDDDSASPLFLLMLERKALYCPYNLFPSLLITWFSLFVGILVYCKLHTLPCRRARTHIRTRQKIPQIRLAVFRKTKFLDIFIGLIGLIVLVAKHCYVCDAWLMNYRHVVQTCVFYTFHASNSLTRYGQPLPWRVAGGSAPARGGRCGAVERGCGRWRFR